MKKTFKPKNKTELKKEINQAIKKHGNEVNLNYIDTSLITDMEDLFCNEYDFNGKIDEWNVSNVRFMAYMFYKCYKFNGDITNWMVYKVEDMRNMFLCAYKFNQDLSNWNVDTVKENSCMFEDSGMTYLPKWYDK